MSAAVTAPSRVLFVTGKLAEPALRSALASMQAPFATEVAMLPITVAALMTTDWIAKHLTVPPGTDLVLIPGLCEGATASIANRFAVRVEKGPKDLREIPEYFGQAAAREDYGAWDIEIIAEINNAPRLSHDAIVREAQRFRDAGADYIDIGCTPGLAFPELGVVVRDLVAQGVRVSIDTFNADEIRTAVNAGATLVLSINGSNLEVASELAGRGVRVVAIPDFGAPLESVAPTLEHSHEARRSLPHRSHHRANRLRLYRVNRALRRNPPPLA